MMRDIVITVIAALLAGEATDFSPWAARRLANWAAKHIYINNKERQARRSEEWEALIVKSLPTNLSKLCFGILLGCSAISHIAGHRTKSIPEIMRRASFRDVILPSGLHLRCYAPHCRVRVRTKDLIPVEFAHITALTPGGPRFDSSMSAEDRRSASNLIVLCPAHHAIVDLNPSYPVQVLRSWKKNREKQ